MILYEKGSTKAEASGTTFTLQDTSNERKLSFKKYYGNTTQETTSGKNIAGVTSVTGYLTQSDDLLTLSSGAKATSFGYLNSYTLIANQTYTLSIFIQGTNTNSNNVNVLLRDVNDNALVTISSNHLNSSVSASFTPTSNVEIYRIQFYAASSAPTTDTISCKIQLEKGNQATSYEPYTHGPTPNPNYPQPINVVTGGNTISVNNGDNLFDINWLSGNDITVENGVASGTSQSFYNNFSKNNSFIPYTNYRNQIAVSIDAYTDGNASTSGNGLIIYIYYTDGTYNSVVFANNQTTKATKTLISNANKVVDKLTFSYSSQGSNIWHVSNFMVVYGNEVKPYKEYTGKQYQINLGKNLFDKNNATFKDNYYLNGSGVETYNTAYTYMTSFIQVQPSTLYTMQGTILNVSGGGRVYYFDNSKTFLSRSDAFSQSNIPYMFKTPNNCQYISFQANKSAIDKDTIQIEKGFATSYSPYKTPIELNKINTYQDTIFKSSGKNLLSLVRTLGVPSDNTYTNTTKRTYDFNTFVLGLSQNNYYSVSKVSSYNITATSITLTSTQTAYGIGVPYKTKPSTTYTIRYDISSSTSNSVGITYYQSDGTYINSVLSTSTNNYITFTTPSNCDFVAIVFRPTQNVSTTYSNIMLVEGETAQPYEPYGKDWYIKKEIGKVVLDGSNYAVTGFGYNNRGTITISDAKPTTYSTQLSLCSHFTFDTSVYSDSGTNVGYCSRNNSGGIFIRFPSETNTQTKANTWLSQNLPILYYVLNTPTYTKVTGELLEQLEELENATTYDNVTNILQSNADLPLYVDLEYLKPLDFSRNGLGYLPNPISAYVTDEINGEYSLTFEYPIQDAMANEIVEDRIVKCKVADGTNQCFVIKKIQKNFDKMSVYCTHLFYMLYDDFLEDTYPQNLSPKPFLDHILSRANYQLPFVANSDIATSKSARYVRKNVVEAILGNINNSMYNLWGMELKRDNWNIGLKARLGADKGEKLIFGKNITGVDVSVDTTGIYTRIMPIGFDGLLLPEKYIDAPNINEYPYPRICLYEFPDIRYDSDLEDTEAYHTLDEAYQALRDAVQELFDKGINKPLINIKVDWLELSKTEEFKQYSALERVDLGDTLTSNLFGMDYETRVIKTIYNPLNDRVEQFEIGTARPSITSEMNQLDFDVINLPSSMLDEAQANATQLITQAMGGYVYKTNSELYIMDNPDPSQAVKVWRWNINGLGYSSTGINGTYGIAMTMDGSIVADFITTGQLSANVISASTIIGVINGNTSQLKLEADQLDLNGAVTANNNFKIKDDGSVEINNGTIELIDDGTTTNPAKISVTNTNNDLLSQLYSSGLFLEMNDGYQKKETSVTYSGYSHKTTDLTTNDYYTTDIDEATSAFYMAKYDSNNNTKNWAFLFPGDNLDSAFKLGYGATTNFEVFNDQSGSFCKINGAIVTTDNNGNTTFTIDGSKGGIISNNDTTSVNSQTVVDGITIKRAGSDYSPGNGVVIETSLFNDWGGQLYIGDNATQGIWFSGWSNGVKSAWKKLALEDSWTGTFTATKSSGNGNVTSANYVRASNTIQLEITFNTSGGSTSVGSNVWAGTLSDIPLPKALISGCGFYGSTMYVGTLETNGTFTIRALGSTSAQNSNDHVISFTYII